MAPRRVHFLFAHRVLPEIALDAGTDLFTEAGEVDLGPAFTQLWDELNRRARPDEYVAPNGLAAFVVVQPGLNGLLVTLPEAIEPGEARYVLLVANDDPAKRLYLTYERGADPATGVETTQLCAWVMSEQGLRHMNLGPRPDPSVDAFVSEVAAAVGAA